MNRWNLPDLNYMDLVCAEVTSLLVLLWTLMTMRSALPWRLWSRPRTNDTVLLIARVVVLHPTPTPLMALFVWWRVVLIYVLSPFVVCILLLWSVAKSPHCFFATSMAVSHMIRTSEWRYILLLYLLNYNAECLDVEVDVRHRPPGSEGLTSLGCEHLPQCSHPNCPLWTAVLVSQWLRTA